MLLLGGGSVFGLAGGRRHRALRSSPHGFLGWPFGAPGQVAPIVPGAVLFDLDRGGHEFEQVSPGPDDGANAYAAAHDGPVEQGVVGAATGASSGGLKGADRVRQRGPSPSRDRPSPPSSPSTPRAHPVDPRTGQLDAARFGLGAEFDHVGGPSTPPEPRGVPGPGRGGRRGKRAAGPRARDDDRRRRHGRDPDQGPVPEGSPASATTGWPGPSTPFARSSTATRSSPSPPGTRPEPDLVELYDLMAAAADCVTRAVGHGPLAAESVDCTDEGGVALRSWRDAFPSAVR